MTLKAKETVTTTTAIQARIKRTREKTERSQGRKTSLTLLGKKKAFNEPGKKREIKVSMVGCEADLTVIL